MSSIAIVAELACVRQGGSRRDPWGHQLRHNSSAADRMEGARAGVGVVGGAAALFERVCVSVCECEGNSDEAGQLE